MMKTIYTRETTIDYQPLEEKTNFIYTVDQKIVLKRLSNIKLFLFVLHIFLLLNFSTLWHLQKQTNNRVVKTRRRLLGDVGAIGLKFVFNKDSSFWNLG